MKLIINAKIQLQKPVNEVFEAIVNPDKMSNYFIGNGSGRMIEGEEVIWNWREFEEEFPVKVIRVVENQKIIFVWDPETTVEITLFEQADKSTLVEVKEGEKELTPDNLKWYGGNSEGWANFLACMKAYIEYGINLRKGAFDFMKKND